MKRALRNLVAAAAAAAIAAGIVGCGPREYQSAAPPSPEQQPATEQTPTSTETIQATGRILDVGIGTQISEARQKLDPLRAPGEHEPDRKEKAGTRIYWKLNGTEYDWIIVWANSAGQITRIRANPRPDQPKPFVEVGDLSRAARVQPHQVMWNVERPDGMSYRLIAQGQDKQARSVYMFALGLEMR